MNVTFNDCKIEVTMPIKQLSESPFVYKLFVEDEGFKLVDKPTIPTIKQNDFVSFFLHDQSIVYGCVSKVVIEQDRQILTYDSGAIETNELLFPQVTGIVNIKLLNCQTVKLMHLKKPIPYDRYLELVSFVEEYTTDKDKAFITLLYNAMINQNKYDTEYAN